MPITIQYSPPAGEPEVLFIDEYLIVVNKPSGLLSVPGRGEDKQDCLISRVQSLYPDALIVHRLDMPTSGILLLARNSETHRQLSNQFQNREVSKQYTAIVAGIIEKQSGKVDLPLITDWPNRPRQKVDFEDGKPSLTHYEVISKNKEDNTTRIKLKPITGRSHQLRVHMLSIGHIIVGDALYSENEGLDNQRLLLHANKIEFTHPQSQQKIIIDCPCPF